MRKVLTIFEVDDDRAITEGVGTIEYIETEMGWVEESGISLANMRILDDDDEDGDYIILKRSDLMNKTDKTFIKSDLKNGDVILRRNGFVEIVCVDTNALITQSGGFNYLEEISSALNDTTDNSEYDIIAVRRPEEPYDCCFNAFKDKRGQLVYERKKPEVVVEEMTLSEVCKALGKDIKIIKE